MRQAKLWASQAFELAKMKGNSQQTPLSTPQSCKTTHNHPKTGQASIWTPDPDRHCASEKQPAKSDH